jgi:hypothetical protein
VILRMSICDDLDKSINSRSLKFDDDCCATASIDRLRNCAEIDRPTPDDRLTSDYRKVQYS